jgi:hypothetical protein
VDGLIQQTGMSVVTATVVENGDILTKLSLQHGSIRNLGCERAMTWTISKRTAVLMELRLKGLKFSGTRNVTMLANGQHFTSVAR